MTQDSIMTQWTMAQSQWHMTQSWPNEPMTHDSIWPNDPWLNHDPMIHDSIMTQMTHGSIIIQLLMTQSWTNDPWFNHNQMTHVSIMTQLLMSQSWPNDRWLNHDPMSNDSIMTQWSMVNIDFHFCLGNRKFRQLFPRHKYYFYSLSSKQYSNLYKRLKCVKFTNNYTMITLSFQYIF